MKKLLLAGLFCISHQFGNAQFTFDSVFASVDLGYASPIGDFGEFADGGFTYQVDIGYKLTKNFGAGVSYISTLTAAVDDSLSTGILGINFFNLHFYLAKSWYKFSDGPFYPYIGIGVGLARIAEPDVTINSETIEGAHRFGLGATFEAGVCISGFTISYDFNLGGMTPEETVFNGGENLNVMYHRFTLGYMYNF